VRKGSLEKFQRLSPSARNYFLTLATPILQGRGDTASVEALYSVDYDRVPVDVKTFIEHTDYCGTSGKDIFPKWRPHLLEVCDPRNGIYECNITGAQGIGKSTFAMFVLAFKIYRASCLRDPALFYGLGAKSRIAFGLYAITKRLIHSVGFYVLRDMILDTSPYFRDVFPRLPHGKEIIRWTSKSLEVIIGSSELHSLGRNLLALAADELNYYEQGAKTENKARDLVADVSRRLESRFLTSGGDIPGVAMYLSQTRTTSDYLEQRIREKKGARGVKVIRGPRWAFAVAGYDHKDGFHPGEDPAFRVFVGTETSDPRVLDKVLRADDGAYVVEPFDPDQAAPEGRVIYVPVAHYRAFMDDIHGSLRNVADEPTGSFTPFFPRREIVEAAFDETLPYPFSAQVLACYERSKQRLQDSFDFRLVTKIEMGHHEPIRHPDAPRYVHLDLSIRGDLTGFAMVHPSAHFRSDKKPDDEDQAQVRESEVVKEAEVDFYVDLKSGPFGEPIDYRTVRVFLAYLRDIGFWIRSITCDQFQCLARGTRVATARGLIPIEEVAAGDVVQTRDGPAPISRRFEFGRQPTKVIRTQHGDELEGTGRHRIEVLAGWNCTQEYRNRRDGLGGARVPQWEWRRMDEIRVGDFVRLWERDSDLDVPPAALVSGDLTELGKGYHGLLSAIDSWTPPTEMTAELAEWLGLIWGDGHVSEDFVGLTVGRFDEVDDACEAFERVFGVQFTPHRCETEAGNAIFRVQVSARWLVRWMRLNGLEKPFVPEAILRSGRFIHAAFLRGLFAADGNVSRVDGQVSLVTVEHTLAQQVRLMLRSGFGFETCLTHVKRKPGACYPNGRDVWRVTVRGSRERFADKVDFMYRRKHEELMGHRSRIGRRIYSRVVSVVDGEAEVFDLAVNGDPSYVANGFVSHNSFDMLQRLRDMGFTAEIQSVDRNSQPYRDLRQAMNEGRVHIPYPAHLTPTECGSREEALRRVTLYQELTGLEHDVHQDKVDHRETNPDGSRGSKDAADAVAAAVFKCLTDKVQPGEAPGTRRGFRQAATAKLARYLDAAGGMW
jgi:intein/homing endonuclease